MEFTDLIDLASEKLGGAVLSANDSKMGHTMHLSKRDVSALTAYLEKL